MERTSNFLRLGTLLVFFAGLAVSCTGLLAQVDTGSVQGTIRDQSGGVIPGAKVTLTNEGTSFTISTLTGTDGSYIFTPVKIGTYTVAAEFQGFQKATHPKVTVDVQQQVAIDLTLRPGAVTETVEVTAAVPLLQTQNASVGQVVGTKPINDLPLNGRNFIFLAQLTAGVTPNEEEGRSLNSTGSFVANGTRSAQNNYLLDGIDNNVDVVDFLNGTAFVVRPSVDSLQEFKVQTTNYSAEIGRAGGAVLNASIKAGTNQLHGDAWEFVRNDKFDAADFFENASNVTKGEYRQNQFGFTLGGPVYIPRLYNGKNKSFWFFDYEGTRIRQATPQVTTVPTAAERASGFTDFTDLISGQGGAKGPDILGRSFPTGTIFDPQTTRQLNPGQADPVTALVVSNCSAAPCYARDPFPGNILPANRLDPNAIALLKLYPLPNGAGVINNYTADPIVKNNTNQFDVRVDQNFSERDQIFVRVSYFDNPQLKPGPFGGIADGGGFNQGNQIGTGRNAALSYTHSFTPTLINEARLGFSGLHAARTQANFSDLSNIPATYGIQGIPQLPKNGGLPNIGVGSITNLGSASFLVSDEFNSTTQVTENLTHIYKSHTFKGGFEFQHIKFSTLQPAWSRGQFNFDGNYTSIPTQVDGSTGRAQLLLTPGPATVPSGISNVGGADTTFASNIANTDNGRNYYGGYFQDDWKTTSKLTLNLGLRWDFFGQVEENFGAQGNIVPGAPFNGATYLIPIERQKDPLSPSFQSTLAKDGIALKYTRVFGLGTSQKTNFGPRFGFAYQLTPKTVLRGGYGIFYGGFENRGYGPNLGENYPFVFNFTFFEPDDAHPITYTVNNSTCGIASLESGFTCIPLTPLAVNAQGLSFNGIQYNYITPYTQGVNFTVQYQVTPNTSWEIGYVGTLGRHLETFSGTNHVHEVLVPSENPQNFVPFPDFARNFSYATTNADTHYHSLQTKLERRFSDGLDFLMTYTYSKAIGDALDLLNGGGLVQGFRAPDVPGVGIQKDMALTSYDIRNVLHFSGGYQLPLGAGKRFMQGVRGPFNQVVGGWSLNYILTLQSGQPVNIPCTIATTAGLGCLALMVPGQSVIGGKHNVNQYWNPLAFSNPPVATKDGQTDFAPLGGAPTQVVGPGFHRFDLSLFKQFKTSESTHLEFRAEFFNLTNHPNFSALSPGAGSINLNFTDTTNFAHLQQTRDAPNDPRQIQFALKFYF